MLKIYLIILPYQKLCVTLQRSTFIYTNAGRELAYSVQVIFMTSLKILGAIVPPCEVLMYSQHLCNVLNSGKGDGTFLLLLLCSTITQIKSSNTMEVLLLFIKAIV